MLVERFSAEGFVFATVRGGGRGKFTLYSISIKSQVWLTTLTLREFRGDGAYVTL